MFIYLFFSGLIWQEKLSRTPGGKRGELAIGPSHLHFNEIISNWFIFTHILEILGYSLCPTLKILKSVVSGFGFNTYFAWVFGVFFLNLSSALWDDSSHRDSEHSISYLHFPVSPLKQTHQLQVNEISMHLGSSTEMNQHSFPDSSPSLCHFPSMARLSLYCHMPFWGKTPESSSSEGGSWYGSRAWSLPCYRALLKHLCRHHLSWVTTSWASNEVRRAKLSLEVLWLDFQ